MSQIERTDLAFGEFVLRLPALELSRGGAPVKLGVHAARLLALLASRRGEVVLRDEIPGAVWGRETHVDFEQGINACVRQMRAALGDDATAPRYVETLPRRGYRFVAEVTHPVRRAPRRARFAALGSLAAGVLVTGLLLAMRAGPAPAGPAKDATLAILPFVTVGSSDRSGALADGLTEDLIAETSRRYGGRLGVIARTSAMAFRGSGATAREIGRTLGAGYLFEGSVRRDGDRVRVVAQLVRTSDQEHVWAGTYDRPLGDLLSLEGEMARTIARALAVQLVPGVDLDSGAASTDPRAWTDYLEARSRLERRPADAKGARVAAQRALAVAPGFARAWLTLALAQWNAAPDHAGREQALETLDRALALDDTLPAAHRFKGDFLLYGAWDVEGARRELARAIELSPSYAEAWHDAAACAAIEGRHDEARRDVARALELDPLSPAVLADVGWYAYFARRWDDAVLGADRTLAVSPRDYWAQTVAVLALTEKGDLAGAARRAEGNMRSRDASPDELAALDRLRPGEAVERYWAWELGRLREPSLASFATPDMLAVAHLGAGDRATALDDLERAVDEHHGWMLPFLKVIPAFDPLRGDPRYEAVEARVGAGIAPGPTLTRVARASL